jgi:hypothetical protein
MPPSNELLPLICQAYLLAWLTCWPVAMGGLGLLALGNLTGGRWAAALRPYYLAAGQTVLFFALLFVPLALVLQYLFPWAQTDYAGAAHLSPSKAMYLSPTFFLARAAGYFIVWLLVAWWLTSVSRLDRPPASRPAMRQAGALSLVLLAPTATFAAYDWGMSLEPEWYSSIYGAIFVAGGVVAVHALGIIMFARTSPAAEDSHVANVFNDLGNLLLAFIMVWTYFSFSQFFLIWSANLPSEITWYLRRFAGGWQAVALATLGICFAVPFLILLSRDVKRAPGQLAKVAVVVLAGYVLNIYWTIVPAFGTAGVMSHVVNAITLLVFVGVWFGMFSWRVGRINARHLRPEITKTDSLE